MKEKISISMEKDFIKELDQKRGDIPRSKFIENLARAGLKQKEVNHEENDAG